MLSLRLWRALRQPPTANFLFRRSYSSAEEPFPWYIGCAQWLAGFLIFPVIAFAGTIYSLGWTVGVANLIGKERARHTFELISLTPPGPLGVSWSMALGYLYRHRTFRNVNQPGNLLTRVLMTAFVLAGLGFFEPDELNTPEGILARVLARVVTLAVALYFEHIQSVTLGLVAGMAAPASTEDGGNAQIFAFALYLGVQILTYVGTVFIAFGAATALFRAASAHGLAAYLLLAAARVVVLIGLREILIGLLWRRLTDRLGATAADIGSLTDRPR